MRTEKCTKGARFNRNEHVSQIHIRLLFIQIVSIFFLWLFQKRFHFIEKYDAVTSSYHKERCENCVKALKKCPFGLMLPNIRFDNPIRVIKTGAFHIHFISWAKSATLTAGT